MTYRRDMRLASVAWVALLASASACGPSDPASGCKDQLLAGDLVITEVFADFAAPAGGTGTDTGKEWFEIYNNADRPLDLKGLTITHSRPDGSKAKSHTMADVTVAPGQYFTLGNATSDLVPAYVDYGYSADLGDFYNTDGGKLALMCGDSEIDSATYDGVKAGHSRELTAQQPPDYTVNDDPANWCQGNDTEFEAGNFGTPGQENDCVPVVMGQCNDNGTMRDVVTPMAGDLVITEVMPNPAATSDTVGEWFEARATTDVDLNGVGLDRAGDTSSPNVITSPDCIHVAAGGYVLFVKSTDASMNGNLPATSIGGTFSFSLVSGSATTPGDVQIVSGATVVDAVSWTKSTSGKSLQLDPDLIDATANDNESNFCDGATIYYTNTSNVSDYGTPGAANEQCALLPPAGMCDDNGTLRAIVPPTAGNLVITEMMPNPAVDATFTSEANQEWFEVTNVGSAAFDLNELGLDRAGDSKAPNVIHAATCESLAPGAFALFAHSADPASNGMLPAVDGTFGFSMINSKCDGTLATPCAIQVLDCSGSADCSTSTPTGTLLDAVTWASTTDGVSMQVKPGSYTTTANDDGANYCPAVATYGNGTNKGTPKADNACM